jgi:hypothetical protein
VEENKNSLRNNIPFENVLAYAEEVNDRTGIKKRFSALRKFLDAAPGHVFLSTDLDSAIARVPAPVRRSANRPIERPAA